MAGDNKSKFWGYAFAGASGPVAVIAGIGNGARMALSGKGSFDEGAALADRIIDKAYEFGEEHGRDAAQSATAVAALVVLKDKGRPPTK